MRRRPVAVFRAQENTRQRGSWRTYLPDRKSTRLNSSHLVISYAVFCLKKKKTYEGLAGAERPAARCARALFCYGGPPGSPQDHNEHCHPLLAVSCAHADEGPAVH